jgi:thioesterase domain-containing protein
MDTETPPWLMPLSTALGEPPFFLVHAVSGSASPYLALARLLDRRCYGLEARGLHGEAPDTSMEGAASAYADAVQRLCPHGPYLLGGWSLGGAVAFEMARVLTQRGGEVALVLLIDTEPDWIPPTPSDAELLARYVDDVAQMHSRADLSLRLGEETLGDLQAQIAAVADVLVTAGLAPAGMEAVLRVRVEVSLLLARAFSSYAPRPLDVRAALLATAGGAAAQEAAWRDLAAGGLNARVVPGDHYTLLRSPHVETLADAVGSTIG